MKWKQHTRPDTRWYSSKGQEAFQRSYSLNKQNNTTVSCAFSKILHTVRILEEPIVLLREPDRLVMPGVKVSHKRLSEWNSSKNYFRKIPSTTVFRTCQQTSEHTALAPGCYRCKDYILGLQWSLHYRSFSLAGTQEIPVTVLRSKSTSHYSFISD